MGSISIMILILIIFVGIPGVLTGIYVIRSFWKETWFRNMVIKFLLWVPLFLGAMLLTIGFYTMWEYSRAEANYLEIDLDSVTGIISDITYNNAKSGRYFCFEFEDGRSYILRDSSRTIPLDTKRWASSVLNRQVTLNIKKYNWLQGLLNAPIFDRYDGEIYGVISKNGHVILDQEMVRLAYYYSYHNSDEAEEAKYLIGIGLPLVIVPALIIRKKFYS